MHLTLAVTFAVAFLNLNALLTHVEGQETECPSCCHGPSGAPGIPGIPGNYGLQGPLGVPGPRGEVGLTGAKGDRGSDGIKGESGTPGLPGEQGLRGLPGVPGSNGERGVPGPSGPSGRNMQRAAFTVARNTRFSSSGGHLTFDEILFAEEGTNFDLSTGTFTCNVPGTYAFMFSVLKTPESNNFYVSLYKNERPTATVHDNTSGYHQLSSSAVMPLQQADRVYLTLNGQVHGTTANFTSFNGFLLYENYIL